MGVITSRFRKTPDSLTTRLEVISQDINRIEDHRKHVQALQKKLVMWLVIYSILFYLVVAIVFFVYYFPDLDFSHKFLYSLPLLLFPVMVLGIKKFLHWYFVKRITENDLKLAELKEKKSKLIEDVMENETYKKATEILQKFAPHRVNKLNESQSDTGGQLSTPSNKSRILTSPGTELRQRGVMNSSLRAAPSHPNTHPGGTPHTPGNAVQTPFPSSKITTQQRHMYGVAPGPPLPRQVLPRERPVVDRVFEYLVGDGPQNRMALVCKVCLSHNGMALAEEFEYLAFRCCYCFHMNDARWQRPDAPKLELDTTLDSDSEGLLDRDNGAVSRDNGVDGDYYTDEDLAEEHDPVEDNMSSEEDKDK